MSGGGPCLDEIIAREIDQRVACGGGTGRLHRQDCLERIAFLGHDFRILLHDFARKPRGQRRVSGICKLLQPCKRVLPRRAPTFQHTGIGSAEPSCLIARDHIIGRDPLTWHEPDPHSRDRHAKKRHDHIAVPDAAMPERAHGRRDIEART
jgi:hypothetical protein